MNARLARLSAYAIALAIGQAIAIFPTTASAGIIGTTGSARVVDAPASVLRGLWESNAYTHIFQEQSNLTLELSLGVDISITGRCANPEDCSPTSLEAGTVVNSYFVHQDALGRRGNIFLQSSITFDEQILGVIVSASSLNASDFLGAPGTTYPTGIDVLRGLDYPRALDAITLSEDRHTISFELQTQVAMDHIRIITAGAVPAPGSLALLVTAGIAAMSRRRVRRA